MDKLVLAVSELKKRQEELVNNLNYQGVHVSTEDSLLVLVRRVLEIETYERTPPDRTILEQIQFPIVQTIIVAEKVMIELEDIE
ncbi:hypothetical protein SAMN04487887_102207 [Enterococcus casseliflavus]|uniref:hypothetical protein n=1 Tax=Enterococcus casseliflavus TaxID=37734 RepID=UPI0008E9D233|nr:hypothetical protein [Enterococcus casseliflavus]SFD56235.1 hypothetical protein SAMN04487887_102207 [Enterococcus casseliflavus]